MGLGIVKYSCTLSCDFETTNNLDHTEVWLAGQYDIYSEEFHYYTDIETFLQSIPDKARVYFHNLKFDGQFILYYLTSHKYKYTKEITRKSIKPCEFNATISNMGQFYRILIKFDDGRYVEMRDSMKIIPMPVASIPKTFGLKNIEKTSIDYESYTEKPDHITDDEIHYLYNDCKIVAEALRIMLDSGQNRLTSSANAMNTYKQTIGVKTFENLFPELTKEEDEFIRYSYKGGWCYVAPEHRNKWLSKGYTIDVNSLYPSRWASVENTPLPYGNPVYFKGKPDTSGLYKLYVAHIRCGFKLKDNMLPTIQIKNSPEYFNVSDYLKDSYIDGILMSMELYLTNIDLQLMIEHYDLYDFEWIDGYYFMSSTCLGVGYITQQMNIKKQAEAEHNGGMRLIAKNSMNQPTGKFASRPYGTHYIPEYDKEDDKVTYRAEVEYDRQTIYLPESVFITAWGRDKTIRTAQKLQDKHQFVYSDTDSIHAIGKMPKWLYDECDPVELGKWKHESSWRTGKFIRAKCYMEQVKVKDKDGNVTYRWNLKCAGLPSNIRNNVKPEDFNIGQVFEGKLQQKVVTGGCVLVETTFEIKE